jgi:hypothetical protein
VRPAAFGSHVIRPLLLAAMSTALLVGLCRPQPAGAAFGPIQLVSKSSREQAAVATEPAISADGQYLAFCAELGGEEGVFREQLETGQVTSVATGPIDFAFCKSEPSNAPYAGAPSISADGRYVSFTTKASLVHTDTEPSTSDVYVADMSTSPPTYELASAVAEPEESGEPEPMPGGSVAAGRVALSADGDRVAFVSGGNVYVRDLATQETILISARRDPLTGMTGQPVSGGGAYEPAGAAISADGSTVAWVGEHLPEQVPLLGDEEAAIKGIEARTGPGLEAQYHEPLWRRVPTPSEAKPPTRRIVGGGDPLAPGCALSGSIKEPQCQGPYPEVVSHRLQRIWEENGYGWGVKLPQLDADGDEVALAGDPEEQYDLFVVDMREGLDRQQAVHHITRWTNPAPAIPVDQVLSANIHPEYLPFTGEVAECAISPDGTRVAFTTVRQHFATPPFTLITELPSAVGRVPELYEVNLGSNTIERATPGPGKDVSTGTNLTEGAGSISFGAGGGLLAFSSPADNLVAGDANEKSDAFLVESIPPAPTGTSTISPRPPQSVIQPAWRMTANAYSRPDGTIRLVARVPGPGTLHTSARAQLGGRLKFRKVAAGRRQSKAPGAVTVDLKLGQGRRALARRPGLVARLRVTFTGQGGQPLHAGLQSRFLRHPKRKGVKR